jgi:hypothetical protein
MYCSPVLRHAHPDAGLRPAREGAGCTAGLRARAAHGACVTAISSSGSGPARLWKYVEVCAEGFARLEHIFKRPAGVVDRLCRRSARRKQTAIGYISPAKRFLGVGLARRLASPICLARTWRPCASCDALLPFVFRQGCLILAACPIASAQIRTKCVAAKEARSPHLSCQSARLGDEARAALAGEIRPEPLALHAQPVLQLR